MPRRQAPDESPRGRSVVDGGGFQTADRLARQGAPDTKSAVHGESKRKAPERAAPPQSKPTSAEAAEPAPAKPVTVPFPAGLDARIRAAIESTGIPSLYPPQADAIEAMLEGQNVLVSIPTASGKSLVAHASILHNVLTRGGKALYVVPLRALASEKYEELRELAAAIGEPRLKVAIATGDLDEADTHLARYDIIVTTSEKADSLIRHSAGWMNDLCCVVADEVHLLGDGYRGPTLEVTLARLLALGNDVRLIGLSATVGNAGEIAKWLRAELVTSTWRPVQLKEGVFHADLIGFADGTVHEVGAGVDPVVRLVTDTTSRDAQALVFVNTRRSTESVALKLAPVLKNHCSPTDRKVLDEAAGRLAAEEGETSRLGERLASALRYGAAFHHAGLSSKQRRVVEDLFRARHVKAIVATPTLAAGVNMPARRVIVRDCYRYEAKMGGNMPLAVLEIKQMTGRAGRPRYDPYGEAVLIAKTEDERDKLWNTYLLGEAEPIVSHLGSESALRIHLLAGIATGLTPSRRAVDKFLDGTFMARDPSYGGRHAIADRVDDTLRFLVDEGFIEAFDHDELRATRFGKRTSDLYVDPMSALTIRDGLAHAKLVKQVEPIALLALVCSTPDVPPLWLRKNDEWVEAMCDEFEGRWLRRPFEGAHDREAFLSDLKTALLLDDWIHEHRLEQMEAKFGMGPGDINNRVTIAEWLLYAAEEIARMDAPDLVEPLKRLKRRVHFGVKDDLLSVIQSLSGIGRYRGRLLAQAGFGTIARLRQAEPEALLRLPGFGPRLVHQVLKQVGSELALGDIQRLARKGAAPATGTGAARSRTDAGPGGDAAEDDAAGDDTDADADRDEGDAAQHKRAKPARPAKQDKKAEAARDKGKADDDAQQTSLSSF